MKRFTFFAGLIALFTVIFMGRMVGNGEMGYPWYLSWWTLFACAIPWYAIHWINIVYEWNRRPVFLFGKYKKTLKGGLSFLEPIFYTTLEDIPVQDVVESIEAKEVQTQDNVSVHLVGLLTYRIDEDRVEEAVIQVNDVRDSIMKRAGSTLTDMAGRVDLDHLMVERKKFSEDIVKVLSERISRWGATVQAFELRQLKINDQEIERAIAMKARAAKEGAAELTRANYQKQIAVALNEAANSLDDNGRWLKDREVLLELCRSAQNNTVLVPIDIMGQFARSFPRRK